MKLTLKLMVIAMMTGSLTACSTALTANNYHQSEARMVQEVSYGNILSMRYVTIDGTNSGQGVATGGLAGAVAGSTYGTGNANVLATAAGGLLGSVFGQGAEEVVTRKKGVELVIALSDGRTVALVQEVSPNTVFEVGQRVRLMASGSSTRVTPDKGTAS